MRILVVEDEHDLADAIARGLRNDGYATDVAYDGEEALAKVEVNDYDLICLDLNLPGVDGRSIARAIRDGEVSLPGEQPRILMLTARGEPSDRIGGLDEGADDYVVKPFEFDELRARIRALLRRDAGRSSALLKVGSLALDTTRHEAHRNGTQLSLSPKSPRRGRSNPTASAVAARPRPAPPPRARARAARRGPGRAAD